MNALSFNDRTNLGAVSGEHNFKSFPTHSLLEHLHVAWTECIGLGNDRNEVDPGRKALHHLNVEWLQSVSCRANEVETGVNAEIDLVATTRLLLLEHVGLVLVIQELNDRLPRIAVVHVVPKTWCIDDGEADWSC